MIRVKYAETDGKIVSLEVKGHANSTTIENHDLVCAAVSACTTGALNALQDVKCFDIKVDSGLVIIKSIKDITNHDQIVLQTLLIQLQTIEEDNKQFIKITK